MTGKCLAVGAIVAVALLLFLLLGLRALDRALAWYDRIAEEMHRERWH